MMTEWKNCLAGKVTDIKNFRCYGNMLKRLQWLLTLLVGLAEGFLEVSPAVIFKYVIEASSIPTSRL